MVWRTHNLALTGLPSSGARRHERNHGAKVIIKFEKTINFYDFLKKIGKKLGL